LTYKTLTPNKHDHNLFYGLLININIFLAPHLPPASKHLKAPQMHLKFRGFLMYSCLLWQIGNVTNLNGRGLTAWMFRTCHKSSQQVVTMGCGGDNDFVSHTIHVWYNMYNYLYIHSVDFDGECR